MLGVRTRRFTDQTQLMRFFRICMHIRVKRPRSDRINRHGSFKFIDYRSSFNIWWRFYFTWANIFHEASKLAVFWTDVNVLSRRTGVYAILKFHWSFVWECLQISFDCLIFYLGNDYLLCSDSASHGSSPFETKCGWIKGQLVTYIMRCLTWFHAAKVILLVPCSVCFVN